MPVLGGTRVVRRGMRVTTYSQITLETFRSRELIISPGVIAAAPAKRKGLVQEEGADALLALAFGIRSRLRIVAAVLMQRLDPVALEALWWICDHFRAQPGSSVWVWSQKAS